MIGQTISHYRITRQLGAGGMGIVYEAEDLDLKVTRALKFLPPGSAVSEEDILRLEREARAAAALEHGNICPVHEIGRDGEQTFIVMSFLEGQTLAERLDDDEPLSIPQALYITGQVGRALSRAHGAGIVHRDIKPANIMLTEDGEPVVMDFGLAKASGMTRVTRTGATLGTAAYMSPEQAKSDTVDGRSDIWSLGVVLYEMLAGQVPFGGDHLAAVAYAVQHRKPESLTRLRPEVPVDLERVVLRAMAKDPAQRYQTVDDFMDDLSAVQAKQGLDRRTLWQDRIRKTQQNKFLVAGLLAAVLLAAAALVFWPRSRPIRSVAVLPVQNLTGDSEQEFRSAGMTDGLIFALSSLEARPRVISRQTIIKYRDSELTLPEIARELGVDAVVESSLLEVGDRIKASIKLIESETEETLWADTYEEPLDHIMGLYGQATRDIARAMDLGLSADDREHLESAAVVDPAAYKAYLKGRFWLGKDKDPDHAAKSVAFFEEAIARDPNFAPAWAGLAQIHSNLVVLTGRTGIEHADIARRAARKALELDPGAAISRAALANVFMLIDLDWAAAGNQWEKIPPRDRESVPGYSMFLRCSGRFDQAITWSRKALAAEPMLSERILNLATSLAWGRRYHEAEPVLEHLLEYYPDDFWGQYTLALCLERTGRHEQALAVFPQALDSSLFLIMGDRARVEGEIAGMLEEMEETGTTDLAWHLSRHYAWLGNREQALRWLKVASVDHPKDFWIANATAEFDFLRSEPEFMDCLRRAGFTEEMVAASQALASEKILGDS